VKQRQKRVERYGSNIDVMALAAASPPVAAGGGGAALGGREVVAAVADRVRTREPSRFNNSLRARPVTVRAIRRAAGAHLL